MLQLKRTTFSQIITFTLLLLGIGIVTSSAFLVSSFLALQGAALFFWGAILLFVAPSKQVSLTLLNASAQAAVANIEREILELNLSKVGIYLPPKNLKNTKFSLVFIPETVKALSSAPEETNEKFHTKEIKGVFVNPPESGLSLLFEENLGFSFLKTKLEQVQYLLSKLLAETLEIVEKAETQIQGNIVTVEITGSVLDETCGQTDYQPKTHKQVGCLLSSAIACALAKATGKPVTIQNETRSREAKTTLMEYKILEDYPVFADKTIQLPPLTLSDERERLNDREIKSSLSRVSGLNILETEVDPNAIKYLETNGSVFILTDVENPQYSYDKIKGYDADAVLIIRFEGFVEVCKTYDSSQTKINNPRTEFATKIFEAIFPTVLKHYDSALYVAKSGFSTLDDCLKTLKAADEIPECSTGGNKIIYLYQIQRFPNQTPLV